MVPVLQLDSQGWLYAYMGHVGCWALFPGPLAPVLTDFPISEIIVTWSSEQEGPAPLKSSCAWMPSVDMSLCFSNECVVTFWGASSPLQIFRWPWLWIQEALLNRQDCGGVGLRPSCVFRGQPVLIGTQLNSYAGGRDTFDNRRCSWVCCSQLEVPKQTASTGWTQRQELCTHKCLGVKFGFVSGPLGSRTSVYTFAYLYRYNGGVLCILLLYKGCTTKASCNLKKKNSFLSSHNQVTVQRISSNSFHPVGKRCLCDILVAAVLLCKDTVLWDGT